MNIFKLSDKEFEKYLKENIDKLDKDWLLEELKKCGLESDYMNEEEIKKGIELLKKSVDDNHKISEHCYYFDDYQMSKLRQETFKLADALNQEKEKNKKAIEYINRMEINSIGTPLSYTSIGKDLLKILKSEKLEE